jgi:hypothetical protein
MPEKKCCNVVSQQQEKNHPGQKGGLDKDRHDSTPIVLHSLTGSKRKRIEKELQWLADFYGLTDINREDWITSLKSEFTELEFQQLQYTCTKAISRKSKHASSL